MDDALGDSSDEHNTATGSSLQPLLMEETPRRLEKQPPLPRQVSPQLRKVSSADDSFGVSRACEIGTSAQSNTAPQQRVSAGNRLRGGVGQQLAWTPGQQVPSTPQHGTLAASRSPMLSLSQGPLADLQQLVQAVTPPDTWQGPISCNGAAAGRPQDQGMLTGLQDTLAGVLSSLQQSVHTIQVQMQQQQQQTQGNQQHVTQDEGQIEDSQSQISPRDRGSSVPSKVPQPQQVCPSSNYRKHSPRRNSFGSQYADLQDRSSLAKGSVSPRKQLPPSPPPEAPRTGYSSPYRPLRFSGVPAGHSNTHIVAEPGTGSSVSATTAAEPTLVAIASSPTRMVPSRQSLSARPHALWPAGNPENLRGLYGEE